MYAKQLVFTHFVFKFYNNQRPNRFMVKSFINIFLFSFVLFLNSYAQHFNFTNYSINNGLSQSVVNCIFQDSKGYIWIGTKDGLNKYQVIQNKFERINYQPDFPYDVTRYCYDIICQSNGNILINTPPILSVYDPRKKSFTHFKSKLEYDGAVKDVKIPIIEDSDGKIWIGSTKGLARLSPETSDFAYFNFVNIKGDKISDVNISALYKDKKGSIWAGTITGLYKYNPTSNCFVESEFEIGNKRKFSFENACIRNILEDKNGNLIIGTEGKGLYALLPALQALYAIQNYNSENSEIGHDIVQTLLIDHSENLWIGTLQGISKTDLKKKKFNLYRRSNSPNSLDLLGNVIASLYKDEDGILWVGNWGQGLNLVNRATNKVEHFSTRLTGNRKISNDFIHSIFQDSDHRIWLGTRDGILIYDKAEKKFSPWNEYFKNSALPTFKQVRIYMIIQDRTSNYWIGTQNGLYKINLKTSAANITENKTTFRPSHLRTAYRVWNSI